MAELLERLTVTQGQAPAHIEDVGERDPADVVREALLLLPPPMDASGQIPETVEKARNSVEEAVSRVLATEVAADPSEAVPGQPVSHGGLTASDGEVEPETAHKIAVGSSIGANCSRVRHQPGAEVDVRAIRAGLKLSQPEFAKAFGLKLAVLCDWEQGRTKPKGVARVLLRVIERSPDTVREVVAVDVQSPAA